MRQLLRDTRLLLLLLPLLLLLLLLLLLPCTWARHCCRGWLMFDRRL
jgi:hypothetical protein